MHEIWAATLLSVIIVSAISVIGILTLAIKKTLLNKMILYFISFSAGALLGDAFLHLIPHSIQAGFTFAVSGYILGGICLSFIVEKVIHWRHCHHPTTDHHHHPFAIMNLVGDLVHNFIDGIIIAGSYLISIPIGLATTIAVVMHEIPQEIGDFGVLLHGGFTRGKALLFNFLVSLTAILGAIATLIVGSRIEGLVDILIPFAAGNFIYIAGADLIPEMHKETKITRSVIQLVTILLGIGIMALLMYVE